MSDGHAKIEPASENAPVPAYNSFDTPISAFTGRKRSGPIEWDRNKEVFNNVSEAIGLTPLVRLNRILREHDIDPSITILAKLEYMNPGGSVKDRIAECMFEVVPKRDSSVLVEASSGNTACGLAMISAARNVRSLFTIPSDCSYEKESVLKAFGAEVIRSEGNEPWYDRTSYLGLARRVETAVRNSGGDPYYLDQYQHPRNPSAHYRTTAEELYEQTNGNIDYVVMGAGTGGTITGVGTRLKELITNCKVIGVHPEGSVVNVKLAEPISHQPRSSLKPDEYTIELEKSGGTWLVEGIGKHHHPPNLTSGIVDTWFAIDDKRSFDLARQLIRCEGILAGGSGGTALAACLELAKLPENKGKVFVFVIPDGARNYISTYLDDGWLALNGCGSIHDAAPYQHWQEAYGGERVQALLSTTLPKEFVWASPTDNVKDVLKLMKSHAAHHCIIVKQQRLFESRKFDNIKSVCSMEDLWGQPSTRLMAAVNEDKWQSCDLDCPLAELMTFLDEMSRVWKLKNPAVLIYDRSNSSSADEYNIHLITSRIVHDLRP